MKLCVDLSTRHTLQSSGKSSKAKRCAKDISRIKLILVLRKILFVHLTSDVLHRTMKRFSPGIYRQLFKFQKPKKYEKSRQSEKVAVDVSCLFSTSRNRGIGNYARWLLNKTFVELGSPSLFRYSSGLVDELSEIQGSKFQEFRKSKTFESINHYVEEKNIGKIITLSPFEENVPSINLEGVEFTVILYDLIPLYRPWQFSNVKSYKGYLEKILKIRENNILAISETTKHEFLEIFPEHKSIRVLPPPVDIEIELPSKSLNTAASINVKFIAFAGADPRKNIARVLAAWSLAVIPNDFELFIVGDTSRQLSKRAIRLLKNQNVYFLGSLQNKVKSKLLSDSNYIICPSTCEGLGLPLIESYINQKRVIYSDISSHKELVASGGISFNPYSIRNLTEIFNEIATGVSITSVELIDKKQNLHQLLKLFEIQ